MLVVVFLLVMAVLYVRAQTLDLGYRVNDLELQIVRAKDDVNTLRARTERALTAIVVTAQAEGVGWRQATRADFEDLSKMMSHE